MAHDPKLPPHLVTMTPGYASSSYYGDGAYAGGEFRSAHNFDYETSFAVEQYDRTHGTTDDELDLAWFDQHLKGQDAFGSLPPVRLYVPGAGFDKWIGSTDLPLPQAKPTDYYLHSGGRASIGNVGVHRLAYDGSLDTTPPGGAEPADHYTNDPRHPVITIEGYDQHWPAASTRLGDVASDPRNPASYATVQPLVPGKVYKWQIAIWPTGRVFAKGHRIRIDITSSDLPHFNPPGRSRPRRRGSRSSGTPRNPPGRAWCVRPAAVRLRHSGGHGR